MALFNFFWKNRSAGRRNPPIDIWRLQAIFHNFKKILQLNNTVLEDMSRLERTLGGEFIFDWNYLAESVRDLATNVHHITYSLNALTGNAYVPLYDSYQAIRTILEDILASNTKTLTETMVLPLHDVRWEHEPLVGINIVCIAELQHKQGIQFAKGFVITSKGCLALLKKECFRADNSGGAEDQEIVKELRLHFERYGYSLASPAFGVTAFLINDDVMLVKEVGRFRVQPDASDMLVEVKSSGEEVNLDDQSRGNPRNGKPQWIDRSVAATVGIVSHLYAGFDPTEKDEKEEIVLLVRPVSGSPVFGTAITGEHEESANGSIVVTARGAQERGEDSYLLRRMHPFDLIRSNIRPHPQGHCFADSRQATDQGRKGLARGSALVANSVLQSLTKTAMVLERIMGMPVQMDWEMDGDGHCTITGLLPVMAPPASISYAAMVEVQRSATVFCEGGQTVQAGVGGGKVFQVNDEQAIADFPAGAVAVARYASPQLTPLLQRAAAIVTECGSAVGHLATVAREMRLPALFGVPHALNLLPSGAEVTVHAGDTKVYKGIIEALLQNGPGELGFTPIDKEYKTLRLLLRFIMPLNLLDPESPVFSPAGCRSFHDVIHFCHEKAVDELAHFQERRPGLGSIQTNRMKLNVPMDIRVLDIGGGMAEKGSLPPVVEDVRSQPFAAFLEGLLQPSAWSENTPSLGFKDIISAMPRSMEMLAAPAESLGENLAIVGHDYINISLRLGYHFSVIDAHLGSDNSRNYVYFRFVGGVADEERRGRRARFIREVLSAMDFKVSLKGDLVIARKKSEWPRVLSASLYVLGALTAFSKQRDTTLLSDTDVDKLFTCFAEAFFPHYTTTAAETYGAAGDH